jgi:hypothetical protein
MNAVQLTKTQQYWKKHVIAGLQSNSTLQNYANQHGIKVQTLYDWKYRLNKIGALGNETSAPVAFQKVQIAPAVQSVCTINLPNGFTVEWPAGASSAALGAILSEIRKLP